MIRRVFASTAWGRRRGGASSRAAASIPAASLLSASIWKRSIWKPSIWGASMLGASICAATVLAPIDQAAASPPAIPGMVGADDREIAPKDRWIDAVGRLNLQGGGTCTATLIAPDLVATAAHCLVFARTGKIARPSSVHFLPGYRKGAFRAHRRAAEIRVHPHWGDPSRRATGIDVAVVRLAAPVEDVAPIPVKRGFSSKAAFTVVSYGQDRPELPSLQEDCRWTPSIETELNVLATTCDVTYGGSGSPVIVGDGPARRVVAVMAAIGVDGAKRVTYAVRLDAFESLWGR